MPHGAPYTFVPPSTRVQRVSRARDAKSTVWRDAPSQDHPYRDGLCGEIRLRLTTETPLFIRGPGEATASFQTPDGRWAIPGSSVRGLLRSVVEIISFSALGPVNDDRYGFRDLQNRALYGDHMAGIVDGQPTPLVTAGWLQRVERGSDPAGPVAKIRLCHFAKVEYGLLGNLWRGNRGIGDRAIAPDRYQAYGVKPGGPLPDLTVPVRIQRSHNQRIEVGKAGARVIPGEYGVSDPASPRRERGKLVATGQPNNWVPGAVKKRASGNPKHHDFMFYGDAGISLAVTQADLDTFEFVHRAEQERKGKRATPNPEWGFWRDAFDAGREIPVFVLTRPGPRGEPELRAFGLAMMFRLAYDLSVGDAVRNAQPEEDADRSRLDFTSALFGHVSKGDEAALRGRVGFGSLVSTSKASPLREVVAVLGTPKPTFYPNYVENGPRNDEAGVPLPPGAGPDGEYATLMDQGARVRGWKRYRPQDADPQPPLPDKASDKVKTRFAPLPPGLTFEGTLRVHNVRPYELGAVLWAIGWGGDATARHTLGVARALGYGRVKLEVVGADLDRNDGEPVRIEDALAAFRDHMEAWAGRSKVAGGWEASLPVQSLLAAARPLPPGERLRHPSLRNTAGDNEFIAAKKARATLPPPLSYERWAEIIKARGGVPPTITYARRPAAQVVGQPPARPTTAGGPPRPHPSGQFAAPRPTPPTTVAPPPSDDPATVLRRAYLKGQQWAQLQAWAKEGDRDKAARIQAARDLLKGDLEKKGAKYPEVMEWLKN